MYSDPSQLNQPYGTSAAAEANGTIVATGITDAVVGATVDSIKLGIDQDNEPSASDPKNELFPGPTGGKS